MPPPQNRLAGSTSPYLLQHAANPVDWYPWSEEALARAREEDKPILLSIGYSACHWCHVMAHESFENPAIAAQMNAGFVCVKVDREERPDLDDIYMAATMAMNQGHGGWPMTVFLTPEQRPFFAGTYFPPDDRHGRPGFPAILRRITELWRDNRDALERVGEELTAHLRQAADARPGSVDLDAAFARLLDQLTRTFDAAWGGFGPAPKFPPATLLRLLLVLHRRGDDGRALQMVRRTLDGMARGGMYDQIGGGFCRYSTDDQWLVPHFEKMLYDNALLTRAYLEAHQVTGDPRYRTIAAEVLDYVLREMTAPAGGFYSATDADSEGVEGKFFVWTRAEFETVLGPDAELAAAWFDVTDQGNWEGHSIPRTPRALDDVAAEFGLDAVSPDGGFPPMAFGPLGRTWLPRRQYAGTYDETWLDNRVPLLPMDFDDRYFQASAPDQQIPYPTGGEPVELVNLSPEGRLSGTIPRTQIVVTFERKSGRITQRIANLDTVLLLPEESRMCLTWRTRITAERDLHEFARAIVVERPLDGATHWPGGIKRGPDG